MGKIINENFLLKYSNLKNKIIAYNSKILNKTDNNKNNKLYRCLKSPCSLNNKHLLSNLIYRASVTSKNSSKIHIGSTGNTLKEKYRNHKTTF